MRKNSFFPLAENGVLSESEIADYHREGFVVPRTQLPPQRVKELRTALDRVIANNPETRPEQLVSVHVVARGEEGVHGDDEFMAIAADPQILDLVEQCIGPDIILWGCQAFCKPPGDGMEVPFHQDGHYWPIRPLATCTVWIAIDDSLAENGCLRVIPGSHREQTLWDHSTSARTDVVLNQQVADERFDVSTAFDVELPAGSLSLHDVYLAHGSGPNRSQRRRAGLAIRYMPGTSVFDRSRSDDFESAGYRVDFSGRPLWLVRGEDKTGKNDFTIGR